MYIRRKVFSLLQDETGEERYFSTTEFDLDVEERSFADKEDKGEKKKGLSTAAKVGAGAAATAAGIIGARYAGKSLLKKSNKALEELKQQIKKDGFTEELKNSNNKIFKKQVLGKKLAAPGDFIVDQSGKVYKFVGDNAKKAGEFVSDKAKKAVEKTKGVFSKKK